MHHLLDFCKIRKKFLGHEDIEEQDEEKNEKTLSITFQAFKLFLKNKSLVYGVIILAISKDEIVLLLHEFDVFFC